MTATKGDDQVGVVGGRPAAPAADAALWDQLAEQFAAIHAAGMTMILGYRACEG